MTTSIERSAKLALIATVLLLGACAGTPSRSTAEPPSASRPQGAPTLPAPNSAQTRVAQQRFDAALKLMRAGERDAALSAFQQLSRDFPQFSGPLTDLGILHAQAGQRGEAISTLSRAVLVNPRNAVAHNWLGSLYREGGDFARAEQAYRRAVDADPQYAPAHRNLGLLYELSLAQPQQALTHYREYQRLTTDEGSIVAAWIRRLESEVGIDVAGAPR